ncbi:MAG: DUF4363 family protein [Ruminococcus sp.]|nr:DUF4363 family protein [Ruminococcus sp.]
MKRLVISLVLMCLIVLASAASLHFVSSRNHELHRCAERVRQAALEGEDTAPAIDKLCGEWESCRALLSLIEDSATLGTISAEVTRLRAYGEACSEELFASLDSIIAQTDMLYRRSLPRLYNIF